LEVLPASGRRGHPSGYEDLAPLRGAYRDVLVFRKGLQRKSFFARVTAQKRYSGKPGPVPRVSGGQECALIRIFFILVVLLVLLSSCGGEKNAITDRAGNRVVLDGGKEFRRVISTAPSNTEIIIALGLGERLVAVDQYSRGVEGVNGALPLVDFFNPDAEAILGIAPDLIIANGHNQTGSGDDPFAALAGLGIAVVYIPMSSSIEAIYEDIAFIAGLLGVTERGAELIRSTKDKIGEIEARRRGIENQMTVYFEIDPAPNMVAPGGGTFLDEMISLIGARNILTEKGILFPSAEIILDRDPDVILTNVPYLEDPVGEIKSRPGFESLRAVKNGRVYRIDTDSSSRPSHNIIKALWEMALAVYPEEYAR
jgi:iron complex transport system substrate-binding protein